MTTEPPPAHPPAVLLLNGPNLSRLGRRRPEVYGTTTLAQIEDRVRRELARHGRGITAAQRHGEGELIELLESHRDHEALVINPAAYMIHGWALRDALEDFGRPVVEVHLSNVLARESFRHESVISPVVTAVVTGGGASAYLAAVRLLADLLGWPGGEPPEGPG